MIRDDFLLVETILFDFFNIFIQPVEVIHMDEPSGKHIKPTVEDSVDTRTLANEGIDGMDDCLKDLIKLIDSAANALLVTTYCRLIGHNQTHIKRCLDLRLKFQDHLSQVLDSWGRPPAGIYSSGPFFWLGAYDQCLSISEATTANQSVQYCRANIHVEARGMQQHQIPIFYGMCLPARCHEQYVYEALPILSLLFKQIFAIQISNDSTVECFKHNDSFFKKLEVAQWAVLAILGFLVLLVMCGTLTDIYRKRRNRKYSVNKESSKSCSHVTVQPETSVPSTRSGASSTRTPFVQDDARSFIYTDAPSHALTYKSAPAVRRTLKKSSCVISTILAFSVRSTYHYLMRPSNRHLNSLHGIRVLSAFWVVVGHAHLFSLEYVGNVRHLWSLLKTNEELSQIIFNSSLSVDSFLLISGTILAYKVHLCLIQRKKEQASFIPRRWLMLWLHRLIRLMPAYLITFLIIYFIFQHSGDGPMWSQRNGIFGARCSSDDIWRQLLFVAPIILLLLHNAPAIGITFVVIILILSIIYRITTMILFRFPTTLASALVGNYSPRTELLEKMFRYLYAAPQARIGPFLIGTLLGWLLSTKSKRTHSTMQIDTLRFFSFLMLAVSLFGANYANHFNIFSVFYAATFRIFWAFGLALLIWLCERGYMQVIYSYLAWDKWIFLSRPVIYKTRYKFPNLLAWSAFLLVVNRVKIFHIPPLIIERKIFKTIRARVASNESDGQAKRNDLEHESRVTLFDQRESKIIELAPQLPAITRTKRWVEENHEEIQHKHSRLFDIGENQIHPDCRHTTTAKDTVLKQVRESDGNQAGMLKSCAEVTSQAKGQFRNLANNIEDVANESSVITKEQYSTIDDVDGLTTRKQKMPLDRNCDEEVSMTENIGFSWIEEAAKKLDTEKSSPWQFPYSKKREVPYRNGSNWQQHFSTHPSSKSSTSTNTGETVIHVINGENLDESYL
uniref:Nose resistant-to-fluoxetine protein N-terminal domain-containing protein n=1 Tax=Setaria digitata TaxID=48799 RepID=A0A915PRF0_9BILA